MHLNCSFLNPGFIVALFATLLLFQGCAGRNRVVREVITDPAVSAEPPGPCDGKLTVKDFTAYDCESFAGLSVSDTLCLTIPEGETYQAVVDRYSINVNQTLTLRTSIPDYPSGYFLVSVTNCTSSGIFKIPEVALAWRVYADTVTGVFSFSEVDPSMQIQRDSLLIRESP
ncbi:MAG: hypothetical protein EA361_10095 [Bacteroidetes bacterium]|nr:MAG: hypothetical protein EA361_10095 [Bacteroidota bacterium]